MDIIIVALTWSDYLFFGDYTVYCLILKLPMIIERNYKLSNGIFEFSFNIEKQDSLVVLKEALTNIGCHSIGIHSPVFYTAKVQWNKINSEMFQAVKQHLTTSIVQSCTRLNIVNF